MAGWGPQMSKPDQNEPNNDPYLNSEEVKYPLFVAEFLPPNHTSNKWVYIDQALLSAGKLGNRCLHTSGYAAETPSVLKAALVPCSFGLARPAHFLLALAGEEGVFRRHLGAVSRRLDTPDPILPWTPAPESSPLDSAAAAPGPNTSLKLTGSSV